METKRNNLSPLPMYKGGILNLPKGKWYAYGAEDTVFAPVGKSLPILINTDDISATVYLAIYRDGEVTPAVVYSQSEIPMHVTHGDDKMTIAVQSFDLPDDLTGALRYVVTVGQSTPATEGWVSAVVCHRPDLLSIEWWDNEDLALDAEFAIPYTAGYKNQLFVPATLGFPDYEFEEEVEQRDGFTFPLKQISYKKYKFNFRTIEEILDCARLARMSDHIRITDTDGVVYNARTFLISPQWLEQGYLANVDAEFTIDTVVKRVGRAYNI